MTRTIKIKPEWMKTELLHMQRWEDEGGQMIENNPPTPDQLSMPPAPINSRKHHTSLQWNEKFVIEPFQRGNGFFLPGRNAWNDHRQT